MGKNGVPLGGMRLESGLIIDANGVVVMPSAMNKEGEGEGDEKTPDSSAGKPVVGAAEG